MRISPITAAFVIPTALLAQPATLPVDKVQQIEQTITTEMARNSIPGLSVAVGSTTGLHWSAGYAMADLENMVPVTPLTEIRLGSISKPITATAVMQLVDKGKIGLTIRSRNTFPPFPKSPGPSPFASSWATWAESVITGATRRTALDTI